MDLEFSQEEAELRDNVRTVLAGACPPSTVRAIYEGKGDAGPVWHKMVELYWPALAVAEEHGGLGLGFVEVAIVAEELGRGTVPGPYLATVTQFAPAVRELGAESPLAAELLARVAAGEVTGTVALAEGGSWEPANVQATATRADDGGWVLTGRKDAVVDGAHADEVLVVARAEGTTGPDGLGAFVVPRSAVSARPRKTLDPTLPLADLTLDGVVVPADRVLAAPGTGAPGAAVAAALDRAGQEATVALAAGTAGACRAIFERTVEYAKVRQQYGKPIGSFQALKHRMANMYLSVERATSLCYFAALTIAEEDGRRAEAASMAKAAAGECQRLVVQDGLQLHGGIGYTWENDLHFLLKRAKVGDVLYGSAVHHRAKLAEMIGFAR